MKRVAIMIVAASAVCLLSATAAADYSIPHSVVGSGGGRTTGTNYTMVGTVGQPAIGVVTGPSNIHEIGFWYLPGWILTGIEDSGPLPTVFRLWQNEPNPFNPVTKIRFAVPSRARVTMKLYDVTGREVRTLTDQDYEQGYYEATLNASGLASGVYFCRMVAGDFVAAKKVMLLK
jgi:hypothetical protein